MGARLDQRPDSPCTVPTLFTDIVHPRPFDEVWRSMPRLHCGSDAELSESGQISRVETFDMYYSVPTVLCAVDALSVLNGIEGEPDTAVAGGVSVRLEAESVELGDDLREFADRCRWVSVVARTIGIVVKHPGGVRLDDIICIQLDRAESESIAARRIVHGCAQVLTKIGRGIDGMEQGSDDAR